jgi:diacylglycerol O-acyltransferase
MYSGYGWTAPGGETELSELEGRTLSQVMDRQKPLWDIHVVEGLKDGRGALIPGYITRLPTDLGTDTPAVILDPTPEASLAIAKRRYRVPRNRSKPQNSLADTLTNAVCRTLENLLTAEAGLVVWPKFFWPTQCRMLSRAW